MCSGRVILSLAITSVIVLGCRPRPAGSTFPTSGLELKLKNHAVRVEIAEDEPARQAGLQGRESLAQDHGMLFVYPQPRRLSFWMKNTSIPLSIAFIDDSGKVLQIEDMEPQVESSTVSISKVRYALEVNQGWFQKNGIGVGDSITDFTERVRPLTAR
jgi:uncharacterized protein